MSCFRLCLRRFLSNYPFRNKNNSYSIQIPLSELDIRWRPCPRAWLDRIRQTPDSADETTLGGRPWGRPRWPDGRVGWPWRGFRGRGLEVDHLLQRVASGHRGSVWNELPDLGVQFVLFFGIAGDVVYEERKSITSLNTQSRTEWPLTTVPWKIDVACKLEFRNEFYTWNKSIWSDDCVDIASTFLPSYNPLPFIISLSLPYPLLSLPFLL